MVEEQVQVGSAQVAVEGVGGKMMLGCEEKMR